MRSTFPPSGYRDLMTSLTALLVGIDRAVTWRLGATVCMVVATGLLAGLAPLALKGMIDAATAVPEAQERVAAKPMLVFAGAYLLSLCGSRLFTELRPLLVGVAEQRLYARLRRRFFAHLLDLPLAFHLDRSTGALVQQLQQAIAGYQMLVFNLVNSVVPVAVEMVTVLVVLVSLGQPALMATFAASALAYFGVLGFHRSELETAARATASASIEMHGKLTDGLLNVESIKCFCAEDAACARFERVNELLAVRWVDLLRIRARSGLAVTATFALSVTALLAVSLHAVSHGTLSVGGFVLANVYMLQLVRPLEMWGAALRDMAQAQAFIRPLLTTLNEPTEKSRECATRAIRGALAAPPQAATTAPVAELADQIASSSIAHRADAISFRRVHFEHGDGRVVLKALDLDIEAGRSIAIVGPSGSGKSSLARLLLRLHAPQAGSILLNDIAIDSLPLAQLRSLIAFVPQDTMLFDDTIGFNIGIGKRGATRVEIERATCLAQVHAFIASLPDGYETRVGERGLKLSGGERQRIAIARALLKDPQVCVFDEATSMLDALTEQALLNNLREWLTGRTTITIAHRLSAARHADEIVVLDGGKVVEKGDHTTLLALNGGYAGLWRAQQRGDRQ